jgi:hypothetical protein
VAPGIEGLDPFKEAALGKLRQQPHGQRRSIGTEPCSSVICDRFDLPRSVERGDQTRQLIGYAYARLWRLGATHDRATWPLLGRQRCDLNIRLEPRPQELRCGRHQPEPVTEKGW